MKLLSVKEVEEKLKELGNVLLKKDYAEKWSKDNPSYGYCYIVSEAIFHYMENKNIEVFCMNLGSEYGTHWFTKIDGIIVDYTASQFPFDIEYSLAVRKGFFKGSIKTSRGFISKRGYEMAKFLQLVS